ncbi:NAD(P)H-binding protein [Streptomyces sp. H27-D2]|uniref:NAD(P)H-binding protein n=1 Tax=Streptomyces sp. H27-D2 TaxID=3046304 RepID=UPI002DBDE3D7|nr:NAD(P)H-binding protein [Streptomyces sp. H27-D2]MEC4020744.1 NAD(P)H-binding protein [Streptomyces sp. H27-D2]
MPDTPMSSAPPNQPNQPNQIDQIDQRETVLVTGGTGNTGRRVAARLAELGHPVRAASRRPAPADDVDHARVEHGRVEPGRVEPGRVEPVRFDWDDASTHVPALRGARGIYLVPPNGASDPAASMLPFLRQARLAGVRRVVLLSSSAIAESNGGLGVVHRATPELFPEWAVLQPSWFMQNFTGEHAHALSIRADDEIVTATGEGRVGFVDSQDIAEVGVRALTDEQPHNTAHLITGPEAIGYDAIAAIVSETAGRPIRHRRVSYEVQRDRFAAVGIPGRFAELLAGMDRAIATGTEDRTSPTVERVTGRAPRSFPVYAAEHAAAWQRP